MTTPSDLATAVQTVAATVLAATTDPAIAVTTLAALADYQPAAPVSDSTIGAAMATMQTSAGALMRRSALVAMCRAASTYQPASYDEALQLRDTIAGLLDAEILQAGDEGSDDTFLALRALRTATVADLTTRGANLSRLVDVTSRAAVPAPVLAQRLYRDSSRADELVDQAPTIHPAFMPLTFKARAT